jgi:DNA-binding transcriptional MerR regulator
VDAATHGLTVDELARRAGLTTRTIRAHQTAGLLPPPRLRGRTGYYGEEHLRRLGAIARLRGRGYSLAAIADLLGAWDEGRTLAHVLGFEPASTPDDWADELFAAYLAPDDPGGLLPAGVWN